MELEYYGKPSKNKGSKKKHLIIFAVVTFSLILFWLIYSSIYGEISLTGGIIGKAVNLNDDSNIKLDAKLTIPSLSLDGKFKRIEISGRSDSYINVGDQRFYLGNIKENYLIFDNYDGKISFNSKNILEFQGKVSGVTVNGVFITPESKNTFKINLNKSFDYESLEISDGVLINKLSYRTLGTIKLNNGNEIFNVNGEEVTINNFYGGLLIENKELYLNGYISSLNILGDSNIYIGE